jgi:AP-1 complex subunit beta-1
VVWQDIFRKYPSTYEGVIPTLCANLDELDEPEAKASLIWIIGEYANKIDNADELLGIFVDTFTEESYPVLISSIQRALEGLIFFRQVQLQTLTAVVKLYLKKPDSSQGVVQRVLNTATKDCDSPDVRDRAYIYWRLLSTDPGAAKVIICTSSACIIGSYNRILGRGSISQTTDFYSSNDCIISLAGGTSWGDLESSQRLSQA